MNQHFVISPFSEEWFLWNSATLFFIILVLVVSRKCHLIHYYELLVHLYFIKQDFSKVLELSQKVGKDNLLNSILTKQTWYNQANAQRLFCRGCTHDEISGEGKWDACSERCQDCLEGAEPMEVDASQEGAPPATAAADPPRPAAGPATGG